MKQTSNIHTHSAWCDGNDTLQAMAAAALAIGFDSLGFSSHAPAPFDLRCPGVSDEAAYREAVHQIKEEYDGQLAVLCGIEQDGYAPVAQPDAYDYIIGSQHYLPPKDGVYTAVDGEPEELLEALQQQYGNDETGMVRAYYYAQAACVKAQKPTVLGHYDLITKYNSGNTIFNTESKSYIDTALEALDDILDTLKEYGGLVEVNTGAIARGIRNTPYPAAFLLRHMAQRGAPVIITTDCHDKTLLGAGYDVALALIRQVGYGKMTVLQGGRFVEVPI